MGGIVDGAWRRFYAFAWRATGIWAGRERSLLPGMGGTAHLFLLGCQNDMRWADVIKRRLHSLLAFHLPYAV